MVVFHTRIYGIDKRDDEKVFRLFHNLLYGEEIMVSSIRYLGDMVANNIVEEIKKQIRDNIITGNG